MSNGSLLHFGWVVLFFVPGLAAAQTPQNSLLFTSEEPHVHLPSGMTFTLQTEAAPLSSEGRTVPAGQLVQTTLQHDLKSSTAKIGDPVELVLLYPLRFEVDRTTVAVPIGAVIRGHVIVASRRDHKTRKSQLGFVFHTLHFGEQEWPVRVRLLQLKGTTFFIPELGAGKSLMQSPHANKDAKAVLGTYKGPGSDDR